MHLAPHQTQPAVVHEARLQPFWEWKRKLPRSRVMRVPGGAVSTWSAPAHFGALPGAAAHAGDDALARAGRVGGRVAVGRHRRPKTRCRCASPKHARTLYSPADAGGASAKVSTAVVRISRRLMERLLWLMARTRHLRWLGLKLGVRTPRSCRRTRGRTRRSCPVGPRRSAGTRGSRGWCPGSGPAGVGRSRRGVRVGGVGVGAGVGVATTSVARDEAESRGRARARLGLRLRDRPWRRRLARRWPRIQDGAWTTPVATQSAPAPAPLTQKPMMVAIVAMRPPPVELAM